MSKENSFTKKKFIIVHCCECGVPFAENTDLSCSVFTGLAQAKESLLECDWSFKGKKAYCSDCNEELFNKQ